jgi:hypothetical protein
MTIMKKNTKLYHGPAQPVKVKSTHLRRAPCKNDKSSTDRA